MLENNFFEVFQIEKIFEIDKEALYQNYLKLQQLFHPDKITSKSNAEKIEALKFSACLNEMFNILNDDKKRAEYLLSLHGLFINCEDSNVKPSQELLIEILELSEERNFSKIEELKKECWNNFKNYYPNNLDQAAQAIIKLQYLSKI